jgi:hypothetical protein
MKYFIITTVLFLSLSLPVMAANLNDYQIPLKAAAKNAGYDEKVVQPEQVAAKLINTALSFLGVIFLVLMIYGGFTWMTARGNDQAVDKAKDIIIAAVIGMVIVVSAYAITYFVVEQLGAGTLK